MHTNTFIAVTSIQPGIDYGILAREQQCHTKPVCNELDGRSDRGRGSRAFVRQTSGPGLDARFWSMVFCYTGDHDVIPDRYPLVSYLRATHVGTYIHVPLRTPAPPHPRSRDTALKWYSPHTMRCKGNYYTAPQSGRNHRYTIANNGKMHTSTNNNFDKTDYFRHASSYNV